MSNFSFVSLRSALADIRVVIFLFFIIRMFGITNPPLEVAHNWRQTDMMMVTRNIAQDDASLLYPAVDYTGNESGVIGMEFPLMNSIIATTINVFGYQHWYGRLINLIVTSIGIYFFYLLIQFIWPGKTAYYASIVLLASLWFAYARKIMPDTFSASFVIAGIYFGLKALNVKLRMLPYLILSALLLIIGGLTKISSFVLLVFLAPSIFSSVHSLGKRSLLACAVFVSLLGALYWYLVWVPYLNTLSDARFFMGKPFSVAFAELAGDPNGIIKRFYQTALGFSGFALFSIGVYLCVKKREKVLLLVLLLGCIVEVLFLFKAGAQFSIHSYYVIPFVPLMAVYAGYALSQFKPNVALVVLVLFCFENIATLYGEFIVKSKYKHVQNADQLLTSLGVAENAVIATNGNVSPTVLYFANRKGYTPSNEQLLNENYRANLVSKGCSYVLIDRNCYSPDVQLPDLAELYSDEHFRLYRLP